MTLGGTVVNGRIVLDGDPPLTEGMRVQVTIPAGPDADPRDEPDNPPPPDAETREEFLEGLRQEIADVRAGVPGMSVEEFAAELKRDYGPPPGPRGGP